MNKKPISIPQDIADKCNEPGQFDRFDKVFSDLAEHTNQEPVKEATPKKRGRPPKAKN